MKEEEEKVEACFLTHNISEVKKACQNFRMGIKTSDKHVDYSYQYA